MKYKEVNKMDNKDKEEVKISEEDKEKAKIKGTVKGDPEFIIE